MGHGGMEAGLRRPGGRARAVAVLIAGASTTVLAGPASADAYQATFAVRASHGYSLVVEAQSSPSGASVTLNASRGGFPTGDSLASYNLDTPAVVSRRRVAARFGQLGEIDVRFHRVPRPAHCEGPAGSFRGTIRFRGEHGFSQVSTRRAPGYLGGYECHLGGITGRPSQRLLRDLHSFEACRPDRGLAYLALTGLHRTVEHGAIAFENTKRLEIRRQANYVGPSGTFSVGSGGNTANVRPRGAFAGSARYVDGQLTGDLTATLPGLENPVDLTPARAGLDDLAPACRQLFG
jgi:hypothetical protein